MRNLFVGYFHTPKNKRADVLKLMGGILGLNRDDIDKVGFFCIRPMLIEEGVAMTLVLLVWVRGDADKKWKAFSSDVMVHCSPAPNRKPQRRAAKLILWSLWSLLESGSVQPSSTPRTKGQ